MRVKPTKIARVILFDPYDADAENHLCILSDRASPSMASWLLTSYDSCSFKNIYVELIIRGTRSEGILQTYHECFKELQRSHSINSEIKFTCSYIYKDLPSCPNLYVWFWNDTPVTAFGLRSNFLQQTFVQENYEQAIPIKAADAAEKFSSCIDYSVKCTFNEIEEDILIVGEHFDINAGTSAQKCRLSLLQKYKDETGARSGLNWGQRGNRNRNEAYIPLPSHIAKSGFFPLNEQHFIAVTDDGHSLLLRVEQQNDKAITTPDSNARLGEYFRNRMGLANGNYITRADLEEYGRSDVDFYKFDDEQFYMDFSVNTNSGNDGSG